MVTIVNPPSKMCNYQPQNDIADSLDLMEETTKWYSDDTWRACLVFCLGLGALGCGFIQAMLWIIALDHIYLMAYLASTMVLLALVVNLISRRPLVNNYSMPVLYAGAFMLIYWSVGMFAYVGQLLWVPLGTLPTPCPTP